jgi:peptide/nickel transport system substrate-binding protein
MATVRSSWLIALLCGAVLLACATPPSSVGRNPRAGDGSAPAVTKAITIGIIGNAEGFGLAGSGGPPGGGWATASEIHSNGLVTSEAQSRKPVGQVAEMVPTLEDGSISVLPDGRVRVTYLLRKNVTWQDGVPFSAHDLVFSYRVAVDPGLPFVTQARQVANLFDTADAPDDHTFVLTFKSPYYQAAVLGLRPFWPYPRHILEAPYDRYVESGNADDMLGLPYWTTAYVHLGPFRLTVFDPGEGLTFTAYDGYFRGRPKLDVIRFKYFANDNALFSTLLAGAADVFLDATLRAELEEQLTERWGASGEGTVRQVPGDGGRYLSTQMRTEYQVEPATRDPRVRAALYTALDREAFAEAMKRPHMAAYGIRPPGDLFHDATKEIFRPYAYDPSRARAMFQALGWEAGPDGQLRNVADGRPYRTAVSSAPGAEDQVAIIADNWRRVGAAVEERLASAALARSTEYLSQFPGFELSGNRADAMLTRFAAQPAGPQNRWSGNNRGGWVDQRIADLVAGYTQSLGEAEQAQAMLRIADYFATELPALLMIYDSGAVGTRTGVIALDDTAGGSGGGSPYGLYSRNAHLWDRR